MIELNRDLIRHVLDIEFEEHSVSYMIVKAEIEYSKTRESFDGTDREFIERYYLPKETRVMSFSEVDDECRLKYRFTSRDQFEYHLAKKVADICSNVGFEMALEK